MKRKLLTFFTSLLFILSIMGFTACSDSPVSFKLNFVVDGEIIKTIDTNGQEAISMPQNPSVEGYTFDGWFWDNGMWQRPFTANSLLNEPLTSDMSVYAKFTKNHTHNYREQVIQPTCTEKGYTLHICSCGDSYKDTYVNALNHDFNNYVSNNDSKCMQDGTKTSKCSRCEERDTITDVGSKLGHNYDTPTYVWNGQNCTATRVCLNDETHIETETVKGVYIKDTDVTCLTCEKGHYKATFTNSAFSEQSTAKDSVDNGSPLNHSFTNYISNNDATCDSDGTKTAKCDRCEETDKITDVGSKKPHTYSTEWTTNDTHHWHTATCEHTNEIKDKATHTASTWIVDENATYESAGSKHKECTVCKKVLETAEIPQLIKDEIRFKTLSVDGTNVYGKIPNSQDEFDFLSEIEKSGNATYKVSKNKSGSEIIESKTAEPIVGDNTYYILVYVNNELDKKYTVTIRRRPIYTVTFNTNGGTLVDSQSIEEDSFATEPTTTRTGYTFVSWDYDFDLPITENKTITASWQVNSYPLTIHYYYKDTTEKIADTYTNQVNFGSSYNVVSPLFTGYTADNLSISGIMDNVDGKIFNVYYSLNRYTVTWENSDGAILEIDDNVEYGETPNYGGDIPTKIGNAQYNFSFDGWYPAISNIIGDVTYTAQFKQNINQYIVTWKNSDGAILEIDNNVEYGETPNYDGDIPTKIGNAQYSYLFDCWNPKISNVIDNITYTAQFKQSINQYTVTFRNYDGSILYSTNTNYGTKVLYNGIIPTKPAVNNKYYEFNGWDKSFDCIVANIDIYATYTNYDVYTFVYHDGSETNINIIENQSIDGLKPNNTETYILENDEKSYIWQKKSEFVFEEIEIIRKVYYITYELNGGINSKDNPLMVYGDEEYVLYDATKIGYLFINWKLNDEKQTSITTLKNINGNIILYANFTPIEYLITYYLFDGDNSIDNPTSYTIEDEIVLKNATKAGYSFIGWFLEEECINQIYIIHQGHSNLQLYAKYEPLRFKGIFDANDGVIKCLDNLKIELNYMFEPSFNETYYIDREEKFNPYIVMRTFIINSSLSSTGYYSFDGWYLDEQLIEPVLNQIVVYKDTILYAKWRETSITNGVPRTLQTNIYSQSRGAGLPRDNTGDIIVEVPYNSNGTIELSWSITVIKSSNGNGTYTYGGASVRVDNLTTKDLLYYTNKTANEDLWGTFSGKTTIFVKPGDIIKLSTSLIKPHISINFASITICSFGKNENIGEIVVRKDLLQKTIAYEEVISVSAEKYGYDFIGWYDENDNLATETWKYLTDKVFYAKYEKAPSQGLEYIHIDGGYSVKGLGECEDDEIIIPLTYEGQVVLAIEKNAFLKSKIKKVIISDNIRAIGYGAFEDCYDLEDVSFGKNVINIDGYAFNDCHSLKSIILPESLKTIGPYVFAHCEKLTEVIIPNNVESIDHSVFIDCQNLETVIIGDKVQSISKYIFADCSKLTNIIFVDTENWYVTNDCSKWEDRVGGESIYVSDSSTNATYFKSTYYDYYWYKLDN